MSKNQWLKVINPVLLVSFLVQLSTVVAVLFGVYGKLVWKIHKNNGLVLLGLVVVHFLLNWSWIKANFLTRRPTSGQ